MALGKPATQSFTAYGGVASRAVDGITNSLFNAGSCTHTEHHPSWWMVDLEKQAYVTKVIKD